LYDQSSIVYGPVSMPFTGFLVSDCAYWNHSTVIGFGRASFPEMTGLW